MNNNGINLRRARVIKFVCPYCGVYTGFDPIIIKGEAYPEEPSTDERSVYGKVRMRAVTSPEPGEKDYAVLKCIACDKRFVAEEDHGRWSAVYPIPHTPVDTKIPQSLRSDLEEAELCFAIGAHKACVEMCATVVEGTWKDQQVTSLKELEERDIISMREFKQADQVRRWANVLKHVSILEPVAREEAEQLLGYLREIPHSIYVKVKKFNDLTERLRKKLGKEDSSQGA